MILAFALTGCEGDDGSTGAAGATGATGATGPQGEQGEGLDPVDQAVADANVESCSVCHKGSGGYHQAVYDEAYDPGDFTVAITSVASAGAGPFTLTIDFDVTYMGAAFDVDPTSAAWLDELVFQPSHWNNTTETFELVGGPFDPFSGITGTIANGGGGSYTLTSTVDYDISTWDGGAIIAKLADGDWEFPDGPTAHFHVYQDQAYDAEELGVNAYDSEANATGCENCHGAPYRKHGNIQADIAGTAEFTYCKSCHYDTRPGGHEEWQYMADEPENWANGVAPTADYTYVANLMNDTHMSHAMEFPYPMSISNCVTCHEGNLPAILDDENFTPETCKSCHVVQGINAWPAGVNTGPAGDYYRPHTAPALDYLWAEAGVDSFHSGDMTGCTTCHGTGAISSFSDYHSGYDQTVYDAVGNRHTVAAGVAIDDVTISGDLITVDFSATDATVNPTLAISFYGWDSKHFIVPAHERDGNDIDCPHSSRPGCNIEWEPGSTKPFFTEDAASIAGDWRVTFDMAGFQAYKTDPIPTLIADGVVKMAEISILPELVVGGVDVNVDAVSTSFDLGGSMIVDDYYQGSAAAVDIDKCGACHENTGVLVHTGAGRYGDSMQVCKVCHNPTFDGSHMEMQSRSIDSYVHAIHAFQPLDEDDVYNENDVVDEARNALHKTHTFPYFTSLACEGCHVNDMATYDVPDQALSMPGAQSDSWTLLDPSDRLIGTVPEYVQGAASRACGSCHRAELIKLDAAGDLAAFDAHTASFGTLVENSNKDQDADGWDEEPVLFGVIDKIMGLFQ